MKPAIDDIAAELREIAQENDAVTKRLVHAADALLQGQDIVGRTSVGQAKEIHKRVGGRIKDVLPAGL